MGASLGWRQSALCQAFARGACWRTGGGGRQRRTQGGRCPGPGPAGNLAPTSLLTEGRGPGVSSWQQEEGPLPWDSGPSQPGQKPRCPCCPGSHSVSAAAAPARPSERSLHPHSNPIGTPARGRQEPGGGERQEGVGQGVSAPPSGPGSPRRSGTGNPGQRDSRPAWGRATIFACSGRGRRACLQSVQNLAWTCTRLDMHTPGCPHPWTCTRLDMHTPGCSHASYPHAWMSTCLSLPSSKNAVRLGAQRGFLGRFQGPEEVWAATAQRVRLPLG